ncbi:ATP-binding protein [Sandarakinorhabdus sp. AAP62]|uniref:ATP-binding protein n=1 Tax=Sandarakinorhabdus sp. AAP62 TaxID=1248916 RepID=UPI0002EC9372|nr:ATP-binding protein [Sandarakinorhabdus sp. AAP62]
MSFKPSPSAWPAPYAEGLASPWIGSLLMNLPIAVALLDSSGRIVTGNDAMQATAGTGWRPGMRPEAMVVGDDAGMLSRAVADVLAGGDAQVLRLALAERPDEVRDINVMSTPPGYGAAALVVMRDIREQIRLEAQVAAVTRLQAVGQLAGGVAHDFNNLLTAILGHAEQLLERFPEPGPEHDAVVEILHNGKRGANLVAQLLAFARQQPQNRQLLCVRELIQGLRPLLVKLLGPAIELDIAASPGLFYVRADPGQLEQVIVNLAVNARDAMEGNGRLVISIADVLRRDVSALGHAMMPAIDFVSIDVSDTGSGIPPDIAAKIFEPFFTTKPQGQGTGLGLSTVYGIVKQSDGYIFAKPGPGGRGTTFSLYLPGRPQPAAVVADRAVVEVPPEPIATGRRVLLVEDEPSVRAVFARGLERKGCVVTTAGDAMVALAILRDGQTFDVLVSDVMMPGIDGVELAFEAARMWPQMGIVLMSGYAELPRHREADARGIRFLAKPFALAELVAAIATAQPLKS